MALAWSASAIAVYAVSSGRVLDSAGIDSVPCRCAAVVMGCVRTLPNGLNNLYFSRRIDAAAELYKAGKVDCCIVSGDNHVKGYDEPSDMKESLAKAGVPADRIVCDYAGFRTLDTVVRAKKVFGADSFIIVSQPDHVRRAVFTARGFGCDAYGYAAKDVNGRYSIKTTIRIYGITHNPNFKEHAAACLRQLAIVTRALLASGAWSGKEDVLLWSAEALTAGKWSRCSEDLSRQAVRGATRMRESCRTKR